MSQQKMITASHIAVEMPAGEEERPHRRDA
jgi:hypothetical protein